jgi:hypothetical protein
MLARGECCEGCIEPGVIVNHKVNYSLALADVKRDGVHVFGIGATLLRETPRCEKFVHSIAIAYSSPHGRCRLRSATRAVPSHHLVRLGLRIGSKFALGAGSTFPLMADWM